VKKSRIAAVVTAVTLVGAPALVGATGAAQSAEPTEVAFTDVGANAFQVPADVHCIEANAVGAQGGQGTNATASGGLGGQVIALLTVLPGQSLQVNVGGAGGDAVGVVPGAGGFNGGAPGGVGVIGTVSGGGGGGASDVRQGGTGPDALALVAAGGGGTGDNDAGGAGGAGGTPGGNGGDGQVALGGAGATIGGGGAGGDGAPASDATLRGADGASATGGAGGGGVNAVGGGGGGGGGFFGGGGGGAAGSGFGSGAGGGGGANLTTLFTIDENNGVDANNDGNGVVILTYEVGDTSCLAAPLTIHKVLGGTVVFAPGTRFDVTISCLAPTINLGTLGRLGTASTVTLSFVANASGAATAVGPDTIAFVNSTDCTVTETANGGATSVSYTCSAQIDSGEDGPVAEGFGNPSAAALGPFPDACSAPGSQASPMLVHIIRPNQSATVTIANQNDPVAPLVLIAPRFTG
jgi:hypothetical protein